MRVIKALVALCFVALGLAFGALNRQRVHIDLGLATAEARLGFLILVVALIGALVGGLVVMAGVVWPMRRRQRAAGERSHSGPVTAEFPALRPYESGEPRP